uniref:Fascin n=1 Tax=Pinctada fucata TaxID=50426 RepID=A0A194AP68_PINFU
MSEVNGINGHKAKAAGLQWKVGIVNSNNKYLTAEKFGNKVNVTGTALKSRQIWTLEQDTREEVVYIKSCSNHYLSSDKYGQVTCDAEEPGHSEKFTVEYAKDTGKWHFKHVEFPNYLSFDNDNLKCFSKSPKEKETWTVQLSIHPQVHLRNVNRRRYAQLNNDEIQFTLTTPWGQQAQIFLEFMGGKYALKTCDGRFLHKNGDLVDACDDNSLYTLEIKSGQNSGLSFMDNEGRYLAPVGSTATLKGRNKNISKDELFTIEDSHPQVIFIANNGRKASIKYGVDVSANQEEEETDLETFQMEYDATHQTWSMKTTENKYWAVDAVTNGIQAKSESIKDTGRFNLEWQDDGTLAIRAHNKKYVHTRQNGSLFTTADSVGDTEKFRVKIVNRPQLVLKSEYGFVGIKGKPDKADAECCCNRVTYDVITLEGSNDGMYAFKASNGKYWSVGSDKRVMADGEGPTKFFIEFHGCSKLVIRTTDGTLLKGEQNGLFKADGTEINNLTQWEF